MKKSHLLLPLALVATLAFTGCTTSPRISGTTSPHFENVALNSFSIDPLPQFIPGAEPDALLRYGDAVQTGLTDALIAKGYEATSPDSADFRVVIHANVVPKTDVYSTPRVGSFGYGRHGFRYHDWAFERIDVRHYKEGTLVVEIIENASNRPVWVGWAESRLSSSGKSASDEQVHSLLAAILDEFPDGETEPPFEAVAMLAPEQP